MKLWKDPESVTVSPALHEFVGGHPLVAETLVRRGITTVKAARAFLDPDAYTPAPPSDMPGLLDAAERIERAIRAKERICVWGDFDVDGQTSTTVLVSALQDLGADVTFHIPVRETESHGIRVPWLEKELDAGARLILTCDTGIDAYEAVTYANSRDVDVIITDHHELPSTLPEAYAIVNPHLLPDEHPLSTLPGVGVAYKLAEALYARANRADETVQLLDLVALGIVADVAVQTGDTRYLLQRGLTALQNTQRLGLLELMKSAKITPARLNEDSIGFGLGPRLNALGRLDDASGIVEFLTTQDLSRARILASQLESLNARRRMLCDQVFAAAQSQIDKDSSLLDYQALILAHSTWPAGVIGIVANRLVEQYNRPVILIATSKDGVGRGSARSVPGCHITESLATQQHLLESFGGHEMAAGLSLAEDNIVALRKGLSEAVAAQIGKIFAEPTMCIDGHLTWDALSQDLVADISRLAPFGSGNPSLLFATDNLKIVSHRTLGRDNRHLLLTLENEEAATQQVVWWQWDHAPLPEEYFDLVYSMRINDFRGKQQLQIVWEDFRDSVPTEKPLIVPPPSLQIIDYRRELHPETLLKPLLDRDDVQIWYEGAVSDDVSGKNRWDLRPASTLVIWTSPPGPEELQIAFNKVKPKKVYLFRNDPDLDKLDVFLKYLTGLVKYALRVSDGRVSLSEFAAMSAHREITIRVGLAWLQARGHIRIVSDVGGELFIAGDRQDQPESAAQLREQLKDLLAETSAYRKHFALMNEQGLRVLLQK